MVSNTNTDQILTMLLSSCYLSKINEESYLLKKWKIIDSALNKSTYSLPSTLPETTIAPENRSSQKEFHLPTIDFHGLWPLVSGKGIMFFFRNFIMIQNGVFPKIGVFTLQIIHFNRVFHYKPSILGAHPYFWFNTQIFGFPPFHQVEGPGNEGINLYIGILGMKLPSFPTSRAS